MTVEVILCTYNRCQSLCKALESVAVSRMPQGTPWNVLVVDNNSSDRTRLMVEDFQRRYPSIFRYIFEQTPGKSNALNRGVRESDADVIAFMDDDVQVDPDWLYMLTRVFDNERFSGSGGRILPELGFRPPAWLRAPGRYGLAPLAMFDLGLEPAELKEPPFGTNMAFRREVFSRYGDFRRDLGPRPGVEIRNEDTEFGMRLLRGGERLWYEPAALVHHAVPPHRVRKSYFLKWWFAKGCADIRESGSEMERHLNIFGAPLMYFRRLVGWIARWFVAFDPSERFACRTKVWWLGGTIRESWARFSAASQLRTSQPPSAR